jgi:Acyltransferase family
MTDLSPRSFSSASQPPLEPAPPAPDGSALSPAVGAAAPRHVALGSLRAFITVLVIAHHTLLAYHPFAPPVGPSLSAMPFWRAFPVVDAQRWRGSLWIVGWNDTFFMALMFLLAGLFVVPSLRRKGAARYLRDRAARLGLPFLVSALVLAPLAYVPSYLQTGGATWSGFWQQWRALPDWPIGPAWFLSLLLAFDLVAVVILALAAPALRRGALEARRATEASTAPSTVARLVRHPVAVFAALLLLSAAAYLPMVSHYGPMRWSVQFPFTVQSSRLFHYAAYFVVGAVLGSRASAGGLLAEGGALARRWYLWVALAAAAFFASATVTERVIASGGASPWWNLLSSLAFVAACAAISFAMMALFLRFAGGRGGRSGLGDSLARNAYGMYIVHYAIVSWLLLACVKASWPGVIKATVVFAAAVAASWGVSAAWRRLRARA